MGYKEKREKYNAMQVRFGKYYNEDGVPCIELITPDDGTFYLSAFRRYCFQVSCTFDGSGSAGSTPVFGLETLATMTQTGSSNLNQEATEKFIISAVAMEAIHKFCDSYCYTMPDNNRGERHGNPEWIRFIDEVYKFIRHESLTRIALETVTA